MFKMKWVNRTTEEKVLDRIKKKYTKVWRKEEHRKWAHSGIVEKYFEGWNKKEKVKI